MTMARHHRYEAPREVTGRWASRGARCAGELAAGWLWRTCWRSDVLEQSEAYIPAGPRRRGSVAGQTSSTGLGAK